MNKSRRIAELNDAFRMTGVGGQMVVTSGVAALSEEKSAALIYAVKAFNDFTEGNDPYGEHDFGAIDIDGEKFYFKIDYYDNSYKAGSEDPSNPNVTSRVMTIMFASEY